MKKLGLGVKLGHYTVLPIIKRGFFRCIRQYMFGSTDTTTSEAAPEVITGLLDGVEDGLPQPLALGHRLGKGHHHSITKKYKNYIKNKS